MKGEVTKEEREELGNWFASLTHTDQWQLFVRLVSDRMVVKTQKVLKNEEDNPHTRGFICGVQWILKGKPEELIRQTQDADRDTETP
jgi:hypothetical protein